MKFHYYFKSKIYTFLKICFDFAFSFFCLFKLYDLIFELTKFFIKPYYKNFQNKKSILIIRKSAGFEDTIKSLPKKKLPFNIYIIPRFILKRFFLHYLGNEYFKDNNYYKKNFLKNLNYLEYKKFINKFSKHLNSYYGVSLILNYNIMYKEVHALADVCKYNNIKFLTLQKEYIFSDARYDILKNIYKKKIFSFRDTIIATYNSQHKNCIISSGLAKKQNIHVVGCPRLDFSHEMRNRIKDYQKKKIVYFSIHINAGLPIYDGRFNTYKANEDKKFDWLRLKKSTEKILGKFVKKNQDIDFIVKTKTGTEDNFDNFSKLQKNIKFIRGSLGHELLQTAYLTIAFNSTTIFESIASGTPVIIPYHKITKDKKKYMMSLPKTDLIRIAKNENQILLYLKMKKKKFSKKLKSDEKKLLKKYMGNDDGKSGLRFYKLLVRLVN